MGEENLLDIIQQLRESERHYRMIMNESMDPTFSFYRDGTYRYVNNAFAAPLGLTPEDIIGKKIWDIFGKEEGDQRFAVLDKVFTEGKLIEFEVRVPRPEGDMYFLTTVKPIHNEHNDVGTVICTSKDITKRIYAETALKEEHRKLTSAMEKIKTLSGLLPICSSSKSIRDDKGYWNEIDSYISKHTNVDFSHSLCPNCADKLYGDQEWYRKQKEAEE